MRDSGRTLWKWLGWGGIGSLMLAAAAGAAPPTPRSLLGWSPNANTPSRTNASTVSRFGAVASRLDLRAPVQSAGSLLESAAFPSRRAAPSMNERRAGEEPAPLGENALRMTEESRAQELARRFHREGLPVARLWETHSALVSLGLNQHGKPGIWLIQKLP